MSLADDTRYERSRESNTLHEVARLIALPFSALFFWSAIALPAIYLSLLMTGIDTTHELLQFLALVVLHVLALVGGQSHRSQFA